MTELTIYDNAKYWVQQYEQVDEIKKFRDKAVAVQAYAKQANDYEMESKAARARVRAERRAGELLRDMEKAKGKRTDLVERGDYVDERPTLDDMGITKDQSSKWQQLSRVPEDEFEKHLEESPTPSAHSLLKKAKPKRETKQMNDSALYFWGRLIDFEDKVFTHPLSFLLDEMTPAMRSDAERIIPILKEWLNKHG